MSAANVEDGVVGPDAQGRRFRRWTVHVGVVGLLGGGAAWLATFEPHQVGSAGRVPIEPVGEPVDASVTAAALRDAADCRNEFERLELDHVTVSEDEPAGLFDSNGAGVAAGDLDGDGRVDLVLANLDAEGTVLWNEAGGADGLEFTTARLDDRGMRSVQLVDVDADGRLDIVSTHRAGGVRWWRNEGRRRFVSEPLYGVSKPAYAMAWADVDLDGDLDLATGSYDAELDQRMRSSFLFSDGAGVFVYLNRGDGTFTRERLSEDAQALTVSWIDLDRDGSPELVVGNDFAMEDMIWRLDGETWTAIRPFDLTSAHTMSFEGGDVDNDGVEEIFTTDMKPTSTDTEVLAAWMPLIASMDGLDKPSGTQRIRNVLLVPQPNGQWLDRGDAAGVDAAGWAWSGRFGDLDNDGDLDLHVANGMIAAETFPYLAGAELVEENVTFENQGAGAFRPNVDWGLGDRASGRGSIIVDVDGDGRLDIVVNNMSSPSTLFLNRVCAGRSIELALRDTSSDNTAAVGASVTIELPDGRRAVRYVRSGGGYLSGAADALHFGVGDSERLTATIRWPDGRITVLADLTTGSRYEVTR